MLQNLAAVLSEIMHVDAVHGNTAFLRSRMGDLDCLITALSLAQGTGGSVGPKFTDIQRWPSRGNLRVGSVLSGFSEREIGLFLCFKLHRRPRRCLRSVS